MVNEIISGVYAKLTKEFGEIKLYTDNSARKTGVLDSKAPLREPNFYVSCKKPSNNRVKDKVFTNTQFLGNRYLRSVALCIECRWFDDWQEVLDRLFMCLEYVPFGETGSVVRGVSMQGEHVDDVLRFFVRYDVFVYYREDEKEKMEKLEMKEEFLWH